MKLFLAGLTQKTFTNLENVGYFTNSGEGFMQNYSQFFNYSTENTNNFCLNEHGNASTPKKSERKFSISMEMNQLNIHGRQKKSSPKRRKQSQVEHVYQVDSKFFFIFVP